MLDFSKTISARLGITERQVANTILLLEQGATIPFISRYRKEITESLDEEQIAAIQSN
jgi:protein Tex